ncbi:MAG: SGNH/GDSL hydrolase family protein [Kiritimatiellae bacterium]|nr:SGNH/GDSL hydrolase family protein [Kiritimatiellia bacterium]
MKNIMPKNILTKIISSIFALVLIISFTGCEDSGGGLSGDTGDNDTNVAVALGDSITQGQGVAPYPGILAGMSGKQVVNAGSGGARAAGAASRAEGLLNQHHPAYLFIMLGSNDAIHGGDPAAVKGAIGAAIGVAIDHQTIPIIATIPPMTESHAMFNDGAQAINSELRALASETGTALVDVNGIIGGNTEAYLQADGLHPSQAGQEAIASGIAGIF